jgi:uncharacterized protein
VMADVSSKLLGQFVECLESTILSAPGGASNSASEPSRSEAVTAPAKAATPAPTQAAAPAEGVRKVDSPEAKPVDLMDAAGAPIAKRVAPILAIVAIGWLLRVLIRRRRK